MSDDKQIETLIEKHKLTPAEVSAIIDTIRNPQPNKETYKHHWGTRKARIGLLSDTHIGSKYDDIGLIENSYNRFKAAKVDAVYHAGDITEGYNRRKGHGFECRLHGSDQQVDEVVNKYPDIGVPTYFILGDHDSWHYESAGVDIGRQIAQQRPDMKYLGMCQATIELKKGCTLMLAHPAKGTAYALSYQIQKMIEAFTGGEKPSILAVGHYHKIEQMFYRNVHAVQTGCHQHQTGWMKRMNISAHMGAHILDITMDKNGGIDKLVTTLIPYY